MEKTKTIKLERRELVWEYYDAEWSQEDWDKLKEYYKERSEEQVESPSRWHENLITIYNAIKDISWDEAWEDFRKWNKGDANTICWEEDHSWTDVNGEYHEHIFKQYLGEFIEEQMREDCWDGGPLDCDGADDSDEDWYVKEDGRIVKDEKNEENN